MITIKKIKTKENPFKRGYHNQILMLKMYLITFGFRIQR